MTTEQTLTGLEFSIAQGQGTIPDKIVVDSDRVLIGSGPHCEIRLPPDQAQAEHVLITFVGGHVYAQARAAQPPPLLNGAPFSEVQVEKGSQLQIGPAAITVSLIEIADQAKLKVDKKKDQVNPLTYVLAAIAVPICLFILFDDSGKNDIQPKPAEVPALWDSEGATCSHDEKEQALALAQDKKILALGRRERSPFDVRDGVLAVPLFEMSAACYRAAGDTARAKDMEVAGQRLKEQMDEAYRAHQMRLEHALDVRSYRVARRETQALLRMLEGKTGDYVTWLSNLDRQLKLKLGDIGKKKR
jgi:hypothetical protein